MPRVTIKRLSRITGIAVLISSHRQVDSRCESDKRNRARLNFDQQYNGACLTTGKSL